LIRVHELSIESVGLGVAILLVLALLLLLPSHARRLARQPVLFLALHGAARGADFLARAESIHRELAFASLVLLLASIGRASVILVLDVGLGRRLTRPLPRIVRDLTQGVVYIIILFTALRTAGVEPGSILTTSALLTAAIALSLQETLGNLVAGLAIQVQRPFDVDDWIQFDTEAKHVGRVLEINWRATKILTLDDVEVIIPNATLAKAPITNFTKPLHHSRRSLYVQVPADIPPQTVHRTILEVLPGSFGVLEDPPPSVVTNAFTDGNLEYWVRFFTEKFDKRDGVDGAARDRIWYAFARAGIPLASPTRYIHMHEVSLESRAREEANRVEKREKILESVDFFRVLSPEQRHTIATRANIRWYGDGEAVVRQGENTTELYIVKTGEVVVRRERTNGADEQDLARLGPGQFFGEMALMTGEPRNATVRAKGACALFVIEHASLAEVLEDAPELAEHISRVIAERQSEIEATDAIAPTNVQERSSLLLGRIRRFFAL
jgi:small-conductance mechanosensitive channel/CRP-like cAMP-binding protein